MDKFRFARLILQPSYGGLLAIVGLALTIMVGSGLLYISRSGLFYEYLFGSGSSATLIETSRSTIALFNNTVFGNPLLNKILFFVFWMVVGLVVYLILSGVGSGLSAAEHLAEESSYVHVQKKRLASDVTLRTALHLIALGLGIIFSVVLIKILLPFGILCARILAGNLGAPISWLYGFLGFIVLCGSLYLGMVLLRFLLLRPRIFGGWEDVIAAEQSEHQTG